MNQQDLERGTMMSCSLAPGRWSERDLWFMEVPFAKKHVETYTILHHQTMWKNQNGHFHMRSVKTPLLLDDCGACGGLHYPMYWGWSSIVGIPFSAKQQSSSRRPSLSFISLAENLFSLRCVWSSKNRCDIYLIPYVGHPGTFDFGIGHVL